MYYLLIAMSKTIQGHRDAANLFFIVSVTYKTGAIKRSRCGFGEKVIPSFFLEEHFFFESTTGSFCLHRSYIREKFGDVDLFLKP